MNIRVLHVVTHMNRGGLETMLMNYYRHIDRTQVQFDFLTHRDFKADYDDEIEALGGEIYHLPRLIPWSGSYHRALDSFFKEHPEYRIVHVHQDCLSSVILKIAQKNGIRVRIAHSHSSSQDKNLKYLVKRYYMKQIPAYATQLFACGVDAGDWMFGGAPYQIVNNAIDTDKYIFSSETSLVIRKQLNIPKNRIVIGHVGRFSYPKNHSFLIDIFASIYRKNNNVCLLLVGDGEGRNAIEDKILSLGLNDSVIFTGLRNDVPDLLQAMDVFVFPSIYEGFPVTMVEAQAAGLPCCVSANVPVESAITDLVEFLPLDKGADFWAERILQRVGEPRRNMLKDIQDAGFDIAETSRWLQNYYLEVVKSHG